MQLAQMFLILLTIYSGLGFVFALAFVSKGAGGIDSAAHSSTFGFRCLIFPGAIALWPLLAKRWLRPAPPQENNAHRLATRAHR